MREDGESALGKFGANGGSGQESDAGVNFDRLLEGFHIIELHHGMKLQPSGCQDFIEPLASGHLRGQRDDLTLGKVGKMDGAFFEKGMAGGADDVKSILFKSFHFEALAGGGERDKAYVRLAGNDRLIHLIGAAIIHLNFDLGKGFEEIFDVGREFVQT